MLMRIVIAAIVLPTTLPDCPAPGVYELAAPARLGLYECLYKPDRMYDRDNSCRAVLKFWNDWHDKCRDKKSLSPIKH